MAPTTFYARKSGRNVRLVVRLCHIADIARKAADALAAVDTVDVQQPSGAVVAEMAVKIGEETASAAVHVLAARATRAVKLLSST